MVRTLGSTNVFHCDVRHDFVHRVEQLVARLLRAGLVRVDPHAGQFLFDRRAHVAEEGAGAGVGVGRRLGRRLGRVMCVMGRVMVGHGRHGGHRVRYGRVELVGRRGRRRHPRHAVELLGARIHFHGQPHLLVVHRRLVVVVVMVVVGRYEAREEDVSVVRVAGGRRGRSRVFRRQRSRRTRPGEHVRMRMRVVLTCGMRVQRGHVASQEEVAGGVRSDVRVRMAVRMVRHWVGRLAEVLAGGLVVAGRHGRVATGVHERVQHR